MRCINCLKRIWPWQRGWITGYLQHGQDNRARFEVEGFAHGQCWIREKRESAWVREGYVDVRQSDVKEGR